MPLSFAPQIGATARLDFGKGYMPPEMVRPRLAVVKWPPIKARG